jgi:hypothetical protein
MQGQQKDTRQPSKVASITAENSPDEKTISKVSSQRQTGSLFHSQGVKPMEETNTLDGLPEEKQEGVISSQFHRPGSFGTRGEKEMNSKNGINSHPEQDRVPVIELDALTAFPRAAFIATQADFLMQTVAELEPLTLPIPEGGAFADGTPITSARLFPLPLEWFRERGAAKAEPVAIRFVERDAHDWVALILPRFADPAEAAYTLLLGLVQETAGRVAPGLFDLKEKVELWGIPQNHPGL